MLEFFPESHEYRLNGRRIPNVTSILSPLSEYAGIPRHILEIAKQRGDYVHKMTEMYLWGTLDEDAVEVEFVPYLDAFKKFLYETGFEAAYIEERVFHTKLLYAGTVDIVGILPAMGRRKKPITALIDTKTTFRLLKSVGPQVAAYEDAWNSQGREKIDERYGLQLKGDGTYKLQPYRSHTDSNIFRSCLAIHNFMYQEAA